MLDSQNNGLVTRVAERFRAMGDENRIRILSLLTQGPANVTALTRELKVNQASVSKHLGILRQAGLVDYERHGAQSIYRITDSSVENLCKLVCDGVMTHAQLQHDALHGVSASGRSVTSNP